MRVAPPLSFLYFSLSIYLSHPHLPSFSPSPSSSFLLFSLSIFPTLTLLPLHLPLSFFFSLPPFPSPSSSPFPSSPLPPIAVLVPEKRRHRRSEGGKRQSNLIVSAPVPCIAMRFSVSMQAEVREGRPSDDLAVDFFMGIYFYIQFIVRHAGVLVSTVYRVHGRSMRYRRYSFLCSL